MSQNVATTDPTVVQTVIDSMWAAMAPHARERMVMTVTDAQGAVLDFRTPATPSTEPAAPDSNTPS